VREAARAVPIHGDTHGQGKIRVLLNPHAQVRTDGILADRAGDAGPDQLFDNPFKLGEVSGRNQQLHTNSFIHYGLNLTPTRIFNNRGKAGLFYR
jgi:hypothetical protein